ncbi:MAG TPA: oxygenase MpaB family protein [Flavobacterium sp.]|uniref:oxygenase MpaB family protein n=1 Tax=Flavobacterium sp. TaxID=239 RepID=UPI002B786789|nr:oxygenase MpaB family protein [Flavobacterium sp.]HNP32710.1 oxygenase MpaB family protein [Flavobacterium sp.]
MELFVEKDSIVRKIWGKSDTVLFIFAGASAEFALNKAVDWLYFTGKLPSDPLGRLFSTVKYAKLIVFSSMDEANASIDTIKHIHETVEKNRDASIPDWAYRDVLFMLIHYSIASYELLERKLNKNEKEEVYNVFYRVGKRMGLKELPENYIQWLPIRESHLAENLKASKYTYDLFKQYKKHLGLMRYEVLIAAQKLVVPKRVKKLLYLQDFSVLTIVISIYKFSRILKLDSIFKNMLLPTEHKTQIKELDVQTV